MKKVKRICLFIFTLVLLFSLFAFVSTNVKADTIQTSDKITYVGASVRTTGSEGIRFVSKVDLTGMGYSATDVEIYGTLVGLGTGDVSGLTVDSATFNGKSIVNIESHALADETNGYFYGSLTGFDSDSVYAKEMTARAYIKLTTGTYIYSTTSIVRSMAEVALKGLQEDASGTLLTNIANYVSNNYTYYKNNQNKLEISKGLYETNYQLLGEMFLKDWNKKFDTKLTTFGETKGSSADFYKSAQTSEKNYSGNAADSKLVTFFNDTEMGAKWGWVLDFLVEYAGATTSGYPGKQIATIRGNDTYNDKWYYGAHLCSYIIGFFTATEEYSTGYGSYKWVTKYANVYPNIAKLNKTVYKDLTNSNFVADGESFTLPAIDSKKGYNVDGWNDGKSTTAVGKSYKVTENKTLEAKYSAINYTITYMDGANEITTFDTSYASYTIENKLTLPTYEKTGYVFDGWYEASDFSGSAVTEIEKGTTENKVYYAKTTESTNVSVNVTYNLDGGVWASNEVEEFTTPLKTVTIPCYRTYESDGSKAFLSHTKHATYWYYIAIQRTEYDNIYVIKQIVDSKNKVTENYDLLISWHDNLTDTTAKTTLMSIYNDASNYVGKYVILSNLPADTATKTKEAAITVNFYDKINIAYTTTYTLETTLPTPIKPGYIFKGWKNSVDTNNYTKFPGYKTNPGDITYTAQWEEAKALTVELIRAEFLKDLNALSEKTVTAADFYSKYNEKLIINSSGVKTGYLYNEAFLAKWNWLFEYAINYGINNSAAGNKYMAIAAKMLGIEYYGTTDANTGSLSYGDRAFTNTLHNILNDTPETKTGSSSSVPNPNVVSPYTDLIKYAQGAGFEIAK